LQAFICVSVIFGIFAIVIFLFVHSDEKRRHVGWIFVVSGLIGIFFHAYHANSIRETRDGFEFGTNIYFIVIVYFFCCYLHFRNIPKLKKKHSNSTAQPGRSQPENISVNPQWKAKTSEGDLFTNEALPSDHDDVSLE
jgi:hypothetical protein